MKFIYEITSGVHKGKYCFILNYFSDSARVCIGGSKWEQQIINLDYNEFDRDDPMSIYDILNMLNSPINPLIAQQVEATDLKADHSEISGG